MSLKCFHFIDSILCSVILHTQSKTRVLCRTAVFLISICSHMPEKSHVTKKSHVLSVLFLSLIDISLHSPPGCDPYQCQFIRLHAGLSLFPQPNECQYSSARCLILACYLVSPYLIIFPEAVRLCNTLLPLSTQLINSTVLRKVPDHTYTLTWSSEDRHLEFADTQIFCTASAFASSNVSIYDFIQFLYGAVVHWVALPLHSQRM